MTTVPQAPTRTMLDGNEIPMLGFGTWPLDDDAAFTAVGEALRAGYRLIDTAARYDNEAGVGRAIAAEDIPRGEVFVTTKLRGAQHGYNLTITGLDESLGRLGLEYVDLYLIHWPLPSIGLFVESWRALIDLRRAGRVRSIGVSNFTAGHIERLVQETGELPAVNQVELHPDFAQPGLRAWHDANGVITEAWSPLGRHTDILSNPALGAIAAAHGRTTAQVILRWHIQIGDVPIPKSAHPERMRQNIAVFDFELTADEMAALAAIDRGHRTGGDPDTNVEL